MKNLLYAKTNNQEVIVHDFTPSVQTAKQLFGSDELGTVEVVVSLSSQKDCDDMIDFLVKIYNCFK